MADDDSRGRLAAMLAPLLRVGQARPFLGLYAALALGLALQVRLGPEQLLLWGGLGLLLLALALSREAAGRIRFLAPSLCLLLLYAWAGTESVGLRVVLRDGRLSATVDQSTVTAPVTDGPAGRAALGIEPAGRPYQPALPPLPGGLEQMLARATGENLASGAFDVRISASDGVSDGPWSFWEAEARDSAPRLVGAEEAPLPGPFRSLGEQRWQNQEVDLVLRNAGPPVMVLLRMDNAGNGLAVRAHAATRELTLHRVTGWKAGPAVAGGPMLLRKPPLAGLQMLLREVLRAWLVGLALIAAGVLLHPLTRAALGPADWWAPRGAGLVSAGLLALLVLAGCAWVASELHERIPHVQDSVAYLFQARTFALGRLSAPLPPVPAAFEHEFILMRDGAWFSKYPPGYPALLALGVLTGAPWLVSPVLAALTIGLLFLLGRALYGGGAALLAALVLAVSPFFVFMSGSMMSHPAGLFLTTLALLLVVKASHSDSTWAPLAAGVALGWLFASRQLTGLAVALPAVAWLAVVRMRQGRSLSPLAALGLGWSWPVISLLAYNRSLTGNPLLNPFELWWDFDRLGFGPEVGMHGGHDLGRGLWNTYANLSLLEQYLFGWPMYLTLTFALLPFVTGRTRPGDWLCAGVALSLIAAYVFYWADGIMFGPRYFYEASGALALLTARGVIAAAETASGSARSLLRRRSPPGSLPLYLALVAALIAGNLLAFLPLQATYQRGYNFVSGERLALVEAAGLRQALVLVPTSEWFAWWEYGSVFSANDPLLRNSVIFGRDLGPSTNRRTLAAFPDRVPYLLHDGRLIRLGADGAPQPAP